MRPPQFDRDVIAALPAVRRYMRALSQSHADDLTQAVVVKALTNWKQFKPGTNLKGWLLTIGRNEFLTQYRKEKRIIYTDQTPDVIATDDLEAALNAKQSIAEIANLPHQMIEPLLRIAAGEKYDLVAKHIGVPVGTIKSRVSRAREALQDRVS